MQHDAPFVVVLVTEPAGDAFDLLDDAVVALGPGVGGAELQEPFDLGPPLLDRACQPGRLGPPPNLLGSVLWLSRVLRNHQFPRVPREAHPEPHQHVTNAVPALFSMSAKCARLHPRR